jgi:hypothetical protein
MIWLLLVPLSVAGTLLTWLLCPLLPAFARPIYGAINNVNGWEVEPRLPGVLSYFSTEDNSLLGDAGHKERWAGKSEYLQMVAWLFRNPAYIFETECLGVTVRPNAVVCVLGNPRIKNRDNAEAGWYFCTVDSAWNFKGVFKWPFLAGCIMLELGWKLQPYAQHGAPAVQDMAQLVFSIRPLTAFNA